MTATLIQPEIVTENPLDVIEQLVTANDWVFDRRSDQEMAVQAPGHWCDYSMYFAWNEDVDAVHFTCAMDMRVPEEKLRPVFELLTLINERMWLGHFGMWSDEGLPMFRHALPLRGVRGPSAEQIGGSGRNRGHRVRTLLSGLPVCDLGR